MDGATIAGFVLAGVAVLGSIGSVLLLAFRVGSLVGTFTSFMSTSERDREALHTDLTRLSDRLSLHIEHHSTV